MKLEAIIENIFGEKPLNYEYITTGLTNDNYIVTLKDRKVVLRIPRSENLGLFDYKQEAHVLSLIEPLNLDTNLIYYNKETGIKCNEYIVKTETFDIEYLERAAHLIKKLHDANLHSNKNFDVKSKFLEFKSRIKNPIYDTTFAHHYIEDIKLENVRLCHNDIVKGNLLFSHTKDYLIDYEYAADNDPYFDVMSFITENDIMDEALRNRFYTIYFGHLPNETERKRLQTFEIIHHVLWCEWAMMMYELHKQDVYKEIADLKYKRLNECFK